MAVYEITFRLKKTGTYQERYLLLNNLLNRFKPYITNEDKETTSTLKIRISDKNTTKGLAEYLINKASLINGDVVELIRFEKGIIIDAGNVIDKKYIPSQKLINYLKS